MLEFALTIFGLAAAMSVPAFLIAVVESATSKMRAAPMRASPVAGRRSFSTAFRHSTGTAPTEYRRALG
jgi:hypothetical protein